MILIEESTVENGSHPFMPQCLPVRSGLFEIGKGVQNYIDPLSSTVLANKLIRNYSFIMQQELPCYQAMIYFLSWIVPRILFPTSQSLHYCTSLLLEHKWRTNRSCFKNYELKFQ